MPLWQLPCALTQADEQKLARFKMFQKDYSLFHICVCRNQVSMGVNFGDRLCSISKLAMGKEHWPQESRDVNSSSGSVVGQLCDTGWGGVMTYQILHLANGQDSIYSTPFELLWQLIGNKNVGSIKRSENLLTLFNPLLPAVISRMLAKAQILHRNQNVLRMSEKETSLISPNHNQHLPRALYLRDRFTHITSGTVWDPVGQKWLPQRQKREVDCSSHILIYSQYLVNQETSWKKGNRHQASSRTVILALGNHTQKMI